jgi:hypothetical protein
MRAISTLAGNVAHGVCVKGKGPSRRLPWDVARCARRSGAKRNRRRPYSIATISFYFERAIVTTPTLRDNRRDDAARASSHMRGDAPRISRAAYIDAASSDRTRKENREASEGCPESRART